MGKLLDDTLITDGDIPIDLIDNHKDNPNTHSRAQIAQLADSHNAYGQYRRVLVWARPDGRYTLVAGHGFTQGATLDGRKTIRAEILPEDTPESVIEAILVADNQHGKNSTIDNDVLAKLLKGQVDSARNLSSIGFTTAEANTLFLKVTQSHSADFLKDVIHPPQPQSQQPQPYRSMPYDPFPSELPPRPPTYEEELQRQGLTPETLAAQTFHSPLPDGYIPPTYTATVPPYAPESNVTQDVQWFPVTYTLTHEQRQSLLDAIKKAKAEWGLETSAEAIAKICSQYVGM